jgi:hypothetical protein
VEKKLALRDQARHLKCRLNSCIAYNTHFVQSQEEFVEEMRRSVNALSSESSALKSAVAFNCELVRQKIIQTVKQNRTFVSCKQQQQYCNVMLLCVCKLHALHPSSPPCMVYMSRAV